MNDKRTQLIAALTVMLAVAMGAAAPALGQQDRSRDATVKLIRFKHIPVHEAMGPIQDVLVSRSEFGGTMVSRVDRTNSLVVSARPNAHYCQDQI